MALTELFFDTFTDTAGTLLTAHTPDTGLGWTSLAGNVASNANIGSDGTAVQPFHNLTGDNYYTANTTQAETLHQRIEVIHGATAVTRACLRLRNGSTAADGIFIEFSSAINRVKIFSVTNAVATEVAASFSALTVPAGATCIATITAANGVTASVNGTPVDWASGVTEFTVNGHDAGKFGWLGRKSYTTGGITSFKGFYDVSGSTPISFDGTIPNQQFTNGQSVNLDLSSYFSGTQTPFTASSIGADLSTIGLSLGTNFIITGTYNGGTLNGVQIRGTDNDLNTADSNTFNISLASTDVNVSINDTLPSLTSALSMTFTPAGVGTITISDWANNTGTALPNLTGITVNVRSLVDGSTVYRTTTASTDAGSDCVVSDAAIVTGTEYEVTALKFNGVDYDIGIAIITAT